MKENGREYMIMLYDFYSELFNEKQRSYFEWYYFDNLSYGEISENIGVSRNAIHKVIQGMEDKLLFYEEKLGLYSKKQSFIEIMNSILDEEIRDRLREVIE